MQKEMVFKGLNVFNCSEDIRDKLFSVLQHVEKFGSVNELQLCKIFGETIWNDGEAYHSHSVSFKITQDTSQPQVSQLILH